MRGQNGVQLHNTKVHTEDCGFVRVGGCLVVIAWCSEYWQLRVRVTSPDWLSLFRFTTPNKHVFAAEAGYAPTQFTMLYIVAVPRVEIKHYSVADSIMLVRSKRCITELL